MSIDMNTTIEAAKELTTGNSPSVKLALWAAALSPNQELEKNGKLVELLRPYVNSPLPEDIDDTFALLKPAKAVLFGTHVKALYYIEAMERQGMLLGLEHIGTGYVEQCLWREKVYALFTGHGLGYKTISFAALLIDPLHCELVPVDRHVMIRLYGTDKSPQSYKKYLAIESEVMVERNLAGYSHIPLALWHWLKWDEQRSKTVRPNAPGYKGNGTIESHRSLSCRIY